MSDATHSPHDGPLCAASRSGSLLAFPHTHTRPPNNLPLELTSFVGWEREIAELNRRAIGHDGYLEEAHRGLMRSQAALGERGQALKHYQALVEMLNDELVAAPETRAFYQSLRSRRRLELLKERSSALGFRRGLFAKESKFSSM